MSLNQIVGFIAAAAALKWGYYWFQKSKKPEVPDSQTKWD